VWIVTRVSRVTVNVPFMTQAFPSPNAGCKTIDEAALSVNVYVIGTFSEFATLASYEGRFTATDSRRVCAGCSRSSHAGR
jgi:hypothetical protein